MSNFEPRIVGIFCNWCTYLAADLADTSRMTYPPNIRVVRLMCSGRLDPQLVFAALRQGADGVLIGGCHPGDCHYQSGNYKARRRATILKQLLKDLGLDDRRVWVRWISASEGKKFADTVTEMTAELKKMGPSSLREEWAL